MTSQENTRAWAYAAFAFSLFLFLAVFIPSLYTGAIAGVAGSMLLIIGALVFSYRMAAKGFTDEKTLPYSEADPRMQPGEKRPLDPEHVDWDDENWRYTHGGPASHEDVRHER